MSKEAIFLLRGILQFSLGLSKIGFFLQMV